MKFLLLQNFILFSTGEMCPGMHTNPRFDAKLLKRIGKVFKIKPSEVLPRDGCEPALTQMHCENFVKFSDNLTEKKAGFDYSRKRKRSGIRPVSKRCTVILAETLDKEDICFYDFELNLWNDKKRIEKKSFSVRCESVEWSSEFTWEQCSNDCTTQMGSKSCKSKSGDVCPSISEERPCDDIHCKNRRSDISASSDMIEIEIDGKVYVINKDVLPSTKQDCHDNHYLLDKKELSISECKQLLEEIQKPAVLLEEIQTPDVPLSPPSGSDLQNIVRLPTEPSEKINYCKDFMFEILNELTRKDDQIEALQRQLQDLILKQ